MHLVVQSNLPHSFRPALEELLFFNPRQGLTEDAIAHSVDRFGAPEIVTDAEGLRVTVGSRGDAQCLFVLREQEHGAELAGLAMFLRTSVKEVVIVHIAVASCCSHTHRASLAVVREMIRAVRAVARRLRGVERLSMSYRPDRLLGIPIRRL